MARPTVRKQLERPGGGSGARAKGRLRLIAAVDGEGYGYAGTANVDVAGVHDVTADSTGLLSFTNVRPNSGASADVITMPAGTVYELTVTFPNRSPLVEHISVPDVTGPVWAKDCLTVPPDELQVFDVVTSGTFNTAIAGLIPLTQKAANSGVASLDPGGKVPAGQVPDLSGTYVAAAQKAAANGVASLDSGTKIPTGQIPSLSATYLTAVQKAAASGVASLDAGTKVPVAQIPDLSATYIAGTQKAAASGVAPLDSSSRVPRVNRPDLDVINVKDAPYNAVGDGVTDDTAAIQAAVTAALVATNPATTTRRGLAAVYIPTGAYKITSPIVVQSVLDFHMYGDGTCSRLVAGAVGMTAVLDINGAAHSSFAGFAIVGTGSATCTRALWLRWNGVARSTTSVFFSDVLVRDLTWTRAAYELGDTAAAGVQVDTTTWVSCTAIGQRTGGDGNTTTWQAGFRVGDGLNANNLLHSFLSCTANHNRWGVYNDASQVMWDGGCLQNNDVDFYTASTGYNLLRGLRSEESQRLYESAGPAGYAAIASIEGVVFDVSNLNPDGFFIKWQTGGSLNLKSVRCPRFGLVTPKISMTGSHPATLTLDGVTTSTPLASFVSVTGAGSVNTMAVYSQQDQTTANASVGSVAVGGALQFHNTGSLATQAGTLTGATDSIEASVPLSIGASHAATGSVRLPNVGNVSWRNAADTADIQGILVNSSDQLLLSAGTSGSAVVKFSVNGEVAYFTTNVLNLSEGVGIRPGTATGTKIGTATNQKIGFHNATPTIQRAGAAQAAADATAATQTTPYGFATQAQADGIVALLNELRAALVEKGIIKGSA